MMIVIVALSALILVKLLLVLIEHLCSINAFLKLLNNYANDGIRRRLLITEYNSDNIDVFFENWVTIGGKCLSISAGGCMLLKMLVDQLCGTFQTLSTVDDENKKTSASDDVNAIKLTELDVIDTIGLGAFGRVQMVRNRVDNRIFALKVMNKKHIVQTSQEEHVISERDILLECRCPFIVTLHRTYRDAQRVYMLMECCIGGEMYTIIRDRGRLDEPSSRYYCAAIIEALEYLHCRSIVYRDLKPENVLLQKDGIPKLVDFGFAKRLDEDDGRTWTFCGTAEYIAPEIVLNKGHDIAVDLWALGVFMYELLTGSPPFLCSDTMSTYNAILRGIESLVWPKYLSQDAITLIFNLCRKEPHQRLGYNRMQDVREASWYSMFDFEAFRSLKMKPPIVPNIRSDADTRNFEHFPVLDRFAIGRETSGWDRDF